MRDFKREKINDLNEAKTEAINKKEYGDSLREQGNYISELLGEINVVDSEDVQGIENSKEQIQEDYEVDLHENVEAPSEEILENTNEMTVEVSEEVGNVDDGISKIEQAESVSDVGKDALEGGRNSLEKSSQEYTELEEEGNELVDDVKSTLDALAQDISNLF